MHVRVVTCHSLQDWSQAHSSAIVRDQVGFLHTRRAQLKTVYESLHLLVIAPGSPHADGAMAQDEVSQKTDDVWSKACRVIADLSRHVTYFEAST